jgi:hypothetical protein
VTKFSKILTVVLMALGLLLGGLVSSAPATAQPDAGTTVSQPGGLNSEVAPTVSGARVTFSGCSGDGCQYYLKVTNTSGVLFHLGPYEYVDNAFRACPWSIGQKLTVTLPSGTVRSYGYGQCYTPQTSGNHRVRQLG